MITVVNPGAYAATQLKDLSEERRKAIDDHLKEARELKEKEIELFHGSTNRLAFIHVFDAELRSQEAPIVIEVQSIWMNDDRPPVVFG